MTAACVSIGDGAFHRRSPRPLPHDSASRGLADPGANVAPRSARSIALTATPPRARGPMRRHGLSARESGTWDRQRHIFPPPNVLTLVCNAAFRTHEVRGRPSAPSRAPGASPLCPPDGHSTETPPPRLSAASPRSGTRRHAPPRGSPLFQLFADL